MKTHTEIIQDYIKLTSSVPDNAKTLRGMLDNSKDITIAEAHVIQELAERIDNNAENFPEA